MTDPNDLPGEMHTPTPDPSDYQPGTEPGLDAMFAELNQAAHAGRPVEPSDALQSFVSIGRVDVSDAATGDVVHDLGTVPMGAGAAPETPRRKPLLSTFTALLASASGKLVLTGGLAAASVAGAHSTGVVDVPLLPDVNEPAVVVVQDDESSTDADLAVQTDTTAPLADGSDDSDSDESTDESTVDTDDRLDDADDMDDDGLDATVTLTINGEEVELTDDEIDTFLEDFEANIEANTEAWEAAVAACEAAFDAITPDDNAALDPADIDGFVARVDDAMQTCFDAIDEAGFAGPLSGLDLDDIEDFDFELDLDDLGELDLDFDLDDLFDDDFPFDNLDGFDLDDLEDLDGFPFGDHDGFPIDPEAFGDFDFGDDFPFGDLPFDPADPAAVEQWLQDQGFDLDFDLSDLEDLEDLEGFDADAFGDFDLEGFGGLDLDDLLDRFVDDWDDLDEEMDDLDDDIDDVEDEIDDLEDELDDDLLDDFDDDLDS